MIINIRGALGTQIFEYVNGIVQAEILRESILGVNINTGGNVVDTVKINWLSQLIECNYPIKITQSKTKQDVWRNKNYFQLISEHKSLVQEIKLKKPIQKNSLKILHIRGKDRRVASVDDYIKIVQKIGPKAKLLGDDTALIDLIIAKAGMGQNISTNAIEDWHLCVGASELYSAFTNFTLSASLFDSNKKIYMLHQDNSHGNEKIHSQAYQCVQVLFDNYFTNATWI